MIKRFAAVCAAAAMMFSLCACSERLQETGNKIVNNAQSYAKDELGVSGDLNASTALDGAQSYIEGELGLNGSEGVLSGTYTSAEEGKDWVWTFDGKGGCTLTSDTYAENSAGRYSVDESAKTVTISLESWGGERVFTYTLRQTLSDTNLTLEGAQDTYKLVLKKS